MAAFIDTILQRLSAESVCGYQRSASPSVEPTALAAMALLGHDRREGATPALEWLNACQSADGSLGVSATEATPRWPTSLAVLAWQAAQQPRTNAIDRAVRWILGDSGHTSPCPEPKGHDTSIVGWSWATDTHCWIEPTALHLLALKATGHSDHPRTREGVRMLIDRLLPDGGCNYGNTIVLGQTLLPHVMPTGVALVALTGEQDNDGRVARSLDYLMRTVTRRTTVASLSFALLALAAHGRPHADAESLLSAATDRTLTRGASPYRLALIALAALGQNAPLVPSFQEIETR